MNGLLGTPPGVVTRSGLDRAPSPLRVRAATCTWRMDRMKHKLTHFILKTLLFN